MRLLTWVPFARGRNWTTRGNVIRYNYFHDISGPYTHGAMAVYPDDSASGTTIFGNVFYKASRSPANCFLGCEINFLYLWWR